MLWLSSGFVPLSQQTTRTSWLQTWKKVQFVLENLRMNWLTAALLLHKISTRGCSLPTSQIQTLSEMILFSAVWGALKSLNSRVPYTVYGFRFWLCQKNFERYMVDCQNSSCMDGCYSKSLRRLTCCSVDLFFLRVTIRLGYNGVLGPVYKQNVFKLGF